MVVTLERRHGRSLTDCLQTSSLRNWSELTEDYFAGSHKKHGNQSTVKLEYLMCLLSDRNGSHSPKNGAVMARKCASKTQTRKRSLCNQLAGWTDLKEVRT